MKLKFSMIIIPLITFGVFISSLPTTAQEWANETYYLHYKFEGDKSNQYFGNGVYLADDVNGDGFGDILIGAHGEDIGAFDEAGRAYIYSGFDGQLLFSYSGEDDHAHFGWSLSDIEDTNGDRLPEFLIGAYSTGIPGVAVGKVYHYSGVDGTLIREYWGEAGYGHSFGFDLEGIGDVNNDGCGDFVVGDDTWCGGPPLWKGAAYVISGHDGTVLQKYTGEYGGEHLGYKVCRIGDVDKDGHPDFAYLTRENYLGNPPKGGRVTVRSGFTGNLLIENFGQVQGEPITRIDSGGDINNDGWPDLLIAQSGYTNGSIYLAGRAFVYSGKDWRRLYVYEGRVKNGGLGGSLATAGDVDNDGYCDFLIAGYGDNEIGVSGGGAVYLHSGRNGALLDVVFGEEPAYYMGMALHGGGDVNGDGLSDIIIGNIANSNNVQQSGSALIYTAKSLKATGQVPLSGMLTLDLCAPACPSMPFYLGFALGAEPGLPLGTRTLPLNGDALFSITFGCPVFAGLLDGSGEKTMTFYIPNDPSLSGLVFYGAFLVVDYTAPQWVRTISNPEMIEVL